MEIHNTKWQAPAYTGQTEQLLADYYRQLSKWALLLTRGDEGKAEDLVQEFCLYFSLTRPDLSEVANLDGYLYTSLRHIYLSGLARASREALHFISVAEFDSFEFAVAHSQSGDPLQRQNDLRRICGYAVWRKKTSKSASYFVLHFFHGYSRREIAELACLPLSAIYNKLKIARTEVRSYLLDPGKLRLLTREQPPEPVSSWKVSSSVELFKELRDRILQARITKCLTEEDLLAQYQTSMSMPIPCSLLSHIVSCECCLAIIDRYFRRPTLRSREPLDGDSPEGSVAIDAKRDAMLRSTHRRWEKVREHRPRTLSIAVNGKIAAFHDVQGEHSTLSARIEHPEEAQFVEVFSEQDVRLALLSIGTPPPEGSHARNQRVSLSDDRWLGLNLTFDGLGLNSQVGYFDPALAVDTVEDREDSPVAWKPERDDNASSPIVQYTHGPSGIAAALARLLRPLVLSSAMAWAVLLAVICGAASYVVYRHANPQMDAEAVLSKSVKIEAANLRGQTEHQVLTLQEVAADGQIMQRGTVDLWKDGDGTRYLRRLYDSRHRLIAAEWRNKNGRQDSSGRQWNKSASGSHHRTRTPELWDQDLSAQAFRGLGEKAPEMHTVEGGGYELITTGPTEGRPQLVSATLVLDSHLQPVRETIRVRAGAGTYELHLIQTDYQRRPSASVPDAFFDPGDDVSHSSEGLHSSLPPQDSFASATPMNVHLAQLQIAVLYELNALNADIGEPIEVARTSEGRIRVAGTIADASLRQKIISHLQGLENHRLLDLELRSPLDKPGSAHRVQKPAEITGVYEVGGVTPSVDAPLRRYLQAKGLAGKQLDSAIAQYSHDALQHAQSALQHAYALDRLGNALSTAELKLIDLDSQQRWTKMMHQHATDLQNQLHLLHEQLAEIAPQAEQNSDADDRLSPISDPAQFSRASTLILHQIQTLNLDVGGLFTSSSSGEPLPAQAALPMTTIEAIPLKQSEEIVRFADQLKASADSAMLGRQSNGNGAKIPGSLPQ